MPLRFRSSKRKSFIKNSVTLSWLGFVLVILVALSRGFLSKQVAKENRIISPKETVAFDPINIKRRLIGALRIDVKAFVPTNHWVVYEIRLYDDQNRLLVAARKEAWRESGVWREGGESGRWSESDLLGGLDVQLGKKQQEEITIAVSVLEYGKTQGKLISQEPIPFQIDIKNGVIDTRYLWIGFFGTLIMAILTTKAEQHKQSKSTNINFRNIQ